MRTLNKILISIFLAASCTAFAQDGLTGKVMEKDASGKESPLGMAGIKWLGTRLSTVTDESGVFHLAFPDSMPARLLVMMAGYRTDTINFKDRNISTIKSVLRTSAQTLSEVKIVGKQNATSSLNTTTLNTELLSQKELTSAACCNISESFERNASVDVNFTDAVSGRKQIQMLGLDGIYTQILYENLPFVRGLSGSHGLTYIPGPWVEKILVTKGTGSVVNGFESITGQIQIEMLEPDVADRFFVNAYANNEKRLELNTHVAKKFGDNLSTLIFAHASRNNLLGQNGMDRNKDGFMDMPMAEQYNIFNRWHYRIKNKAEGQFGVRFLSENKTGGQLHGQSADSTGDHFEIGVNTRQLEVFTKNGFLYPDKPWKSIAIMTTERFHQLNSFFGRKRYDGEQKSLYVNTISQGIINNTFHKIKMGASLIADDFKESFYEGIPFKLDSVFDSGQIVPGGYAEYTFNNDSNISLVAGLRGDYLEGIGLLGSPRLHVKFNPNKETVLRITGGSGFRTPHIFVENSQLFASSRQVVIREKLNTEVAWNYGATFTYCWKKIPVLGKDASFNIDYFITDFKDQVVVDLEDPDKVQFYNLQGRSYSNSLQMDFSFSPVERLDVKLAYKYYEVKTTYLAAGGPSGKLLDKPLVPKDRALLNIDYYTNHEKWKFNFTAKWFGQSRLPNTSGNPAEFQLPERPPAYYSFMGQITKRYMNFEFYLGGENLLDYRIENPIIDPANPYGTNFDATMIWGPINGRVIYGGFRYKII